MKKNKKYYVIVLLGVLLTVFINKNVDAVSGNQGYAVYRDGAFGGLFWHAAIMNNPYSTSVDAVVHHSGKGYVQRDSWTKFIDGNSFKGTYRPKSTPSSADRDLFVAMGRKLADDQISYNAAYEVYYNTSTSGSWVNTNEITSMRCDGVVEYIYEWYGYRVYGSDTYWDVTKVSFWGRDHHSGTAVTPEKQASYLTKVP
ncbi:hypothetical protein [Clostridium grantii]|uniref:Uncharacterized protein n=1 Tax=Clostridium grantii DSM 8605 TaxID=1121316 RepID=A0A1M5VN57_9CLOT|nr:hypothetical protein [Clostridium grantii]SHH76667.1 hypothetical protein SAMN02745207_02379 [Clostridium grantii DSM 8605]